MLNKAKSADANAAQLIRGIRAQKSYMNTMDHSTLIPPKTVRVGVGCIVRRNNDVLLIKRENTHGAGSWSTPGGHLDFGESIEECAIREVLEETGLEIRNIRFVAVTNDYFESENKHYITIWTEGDYISGVPSMNAEHEMSEIGWFGWDAFPSPLFLSLKNLLDGLCYPKFELF